MNKSTRIGQPNHHFVEILAKNLRRKEKTLKFVTSKRAALFYLFLVNTLDRIHTYTPTRDHRKKCRCPTKKALAIALHSVVDEANERERERDHSVGRVIQLAGSFSWQARVEVCAGREREKES